MYRFSPITMEEASEVLRWRYHDLTYVLQPADENFDDDLRALLRPDYHYYAVHDATGVLVGFCCYGEDAQVAGGDYAAPALDIGMGLRPDLAGHGHGETFVRLILNFISEVSTAHVARLAVAEFNERAITVYRRVGFVETRRYEQETNNSIYEFVEMEKQITHAHK